MSDLLYYTLGYLALSSDALLFGAFIVVFPVALALLMTYLFMKHEAPSASEDDEPYGEASSYRRDRKP